MHCIVKLFTLCYKHNNCDLTDIIRSTFALTIHAHFLNRYIIHVKQVNDLSLSILQIITVCYVLPFLDTSTLLILVYIDIQQIKVSTNEIVIVYMTVGTRQNRNALLRQDDKLLVLQTLF